MQKAAGKIKANLEKRGVEYEDDPIEYPFHSSLKNLDVQIQQAAKRVKESEELNPRGKISQTLFIIDDLLGSYRGSKAGVLEKLMVSGRHQAITVMVLSQQWRSLSPVIRKQISHLGLWAGPLFETNAIRDELVGQGGLDKESFDLAFNIATKKTWLPFHQDGITTRVLFEPHQKARP